MEVLGRLRTHFFLFFFNIVRKQAFIFVTMSSTNKFNERAALDLRVRMLILK